MKLYFVCFFYILFNSLAVLADEKATVPSISTITEMAEEAVRKKIALEPNAKLIITPQDLSGRLVPPACYPPVKVELASDREIGRNNTVRVSCDSPDYDYPWQIFLSVRVEIMYPVVVANEILSPDSVISPEQLNIEYLDQYSLRGRFFSDLNAVIGTKTKRRINKGNPILSNHLCFVCKGDGVSIYAKSHNLQIKTVGEALRDGNIGDTIRVKNSNSNRELEATVIGIGEVEVRM
ncbi:flagellar basal body P-ring formation chaperone FlgA [Shewanella gaetbuli]|uniref:Flagella basal body P-ring formation protein FlgA n=1 Tax=Shewanella gaetbuli TaxID=220752 RepID=A0A9X1ZH97_9GAMM|nr:flagellar basal body P-ring formation chaperone FlgA [Shewanella gaetbuli]MCL1141713.1 flagellar basal body P-ring formation protein FlgA [Shewanella gaetbuli]